MRTIDVVIVTEEQYLNPKEKSWYADQVILEDQLLIDAFERAGMTAIRMDWTSKDFDWTTTRTAIIRATWDYHKKFEVFKSWVLRTNESTQLFNSPDALMWNTDKVYLQQMEKAGINIPASLFFKADDKLDILQIISELDWAKFVIKPRVSASARDTYAFDRELAKENQELYNSLLHGQDMMIQEFQNNVPLHGEISLMVFGDTFSHAVIKTAIKGDFRVQDNHGGTVANHQANPEEVAFARSCVKACPHDTAYARIDIFRDNSGELALGELEIIEPELWFREYAPAADLLVAAIKARI
jgi:glutathione synthase/RimK-type ligase-like ATP-grasp enzyme